MSATTERQTYTRSLRWIPCVNQLDEDVPPYGLVELEGTVERGFVVVKPREDDAECFVNGPVPIPAGKAGQVTDGGPVIVATNAKVLAGESWGATANSFLAAKDKKGFVAISSSSTSNYAYFRRVQGHVALAEGAIPVKVASSASVIASPVSGDYVGNVLVRISSSSWQVGDEVRIRLLTGGGAKLLSGRTYPG